jgi:hypothetical protein
VLPYVVDVQNKTERIIFSTPESKYSVKVVENPQPYFIGRNMSSLKEEFVLIDEMSDA